MRGVTLYLNEMIEEREREQRRRARRAFAGAATLALLGLAAVWPEPTLPPPPAKNTVRFILVPLLPELESTSTVRTETKTIVKFLPAPHAVAPLPQGHHWTGFGAPPPTRHLCATPKQLRLGGETASDRVTISNVGDAPMRITMIEALPKRSSFFVNKSGCDGRTLQPQERCTVEVALFDGNGETMALLITDDAGEVDHVGIEAPPVTAAPAS